MSRYEIARRGVAELIADTAFVKGSDHWSFCEDSRVTPATEQDVVNRPAYIL